MPTAEKYERHLAMQLIKQAILKEWRLQLMSGITLLAGGIAFAWVFFEKRNVLATFGLLSTVIGLRLLWEIFKQPGVASHPLWKLIQQEPTKIVWVYSVNTRTMPYGFHLWDRGTMYFKLIDGNEHTLFLPAGKLKLVSKFLNRLLPHASFGYSKEREAMFSEDPRQLLSKPFPE